MDTASKFHSNPNVHLHHHQDNFISSSDKGQPLISTDDHQLVNDPLYIDVANYLMSNVGEGEGEGVDEHVLLGNNDGFEGSDSDNIEAKKLKAQDCDRDSSFAFRTRTTLEFMDDGYKWRKYGKKAIKNKSFPRGHKSYELRWARVSKCVDRHYFKCKSGGCSVKKRVERDGEDASFVITTYRGLHNHPSSSSSSSSL